MPTRSKNVQLILKTQPTQKVSLVPTLGVRGKTARCKPKQVDSDQVEITREFKLLHKSVTLVADIFFVNGIPFLVTLSRKLLFVNVKHMGSSTDNELIRYLNKACRFYARASYNVEVLLT